MVCKGKEYNITRAFSYLTKVSNEKEKQKKEILKNISLIKKNLYLDIGSGSGDVFIDISKNFKKSIAIEPGDKMFSLLKENVANSKNIILEKKTWNDFYKLNKDRYKNKFDLITSIHSVYFLKNLKKEIKNMLSLLNKDGILIIISSSGKKVDVKDLKLDFVKFFRHKILKEDLEAKEYSYIKDWYQDVKVKKLNCRLKLINLKYLENNHLSRESEDTNYVFKFFFKKWWDEYTPDEKKEFKNYLRKYLSKNKKHYLIPSKNQFCYVFFKKDFI